MNFLTDALNQLETKGLKRELKNISGTQGPHVILDGTSVLNFCSNNYLGLAEDERLRNVAIDCIREQGLGSGASRLVCGNMKSHRELEQKIAEFKGTDNCLVFSTGYMANVGIISSLFNKDDMILCDKLNHASIIDGILLSGAHYKRYPHLDMDALEDILKKSRRGDSVSRPYRKIVIITDTVFSMDGDIAPLDKIVSLAQRYQAVIMIDEAHAFGVLGANGKGAAEHFGVADRIDIQMGTLSKAAGAFGAYCCGSNELISFLINRARSFIYTTGMPPAISAAAMVAIDIIKKDVNRRQKLWSNTRYLKEGLQQAGFNVMNTQTPIIPILVGDASSAVEFSKRLDS